MDQEKEMDFKNVLIGVSEDEYGDSYRSDIFEIYRTYLGSSHQISARREKANSFFLTLNTAVVGLMGYVVGTGKIQDDEPLIALICLAGIGLSYLWYRIIRSYRSLNSAKYKVIHEIEALLPLKPYDAEWEAVGRGKDPKLYLPFTHVELIVPWIFLGLHTVTTFRVIFF